MARLLLCGTRHAYVFGKLEELLLCAFSCTIDFDIAALSKVESCGVSVRARADQVHAVALTGRFATLTAIATCLKLPADVTQCLINI